VEVFDPASTREIFLSQVKDKDKVKVKVMLRPTVSRPVCLGIKHRSGTYDQIFSTVRQLVGGLLMWGALFDDRTGLSFTIAPGPCQCRHFRVRLPWDSWP
jgi:hypothetical protein